MSDRIEIAEEQIDKAFEKLDRDAKSGGYSLNPDTEFTKEIIEGILVNQARYGYWACPCRISSGVKASDLDIICPCDYRDPDLSEFDACYCGLYVSRKIISGDKKLKSIPERRPPEAEREKMLSQSGSNEVDNMEHTSRELAYPVYRCKVCGYLCARNEPPEICPVCKVKKERFERFM